jgi:hypothetical protein
MAGSAVLVERRDKTRGHRAKRYAGDEEAKGDGTGWPQLPPQVSEMRHLSLLVAIWLAGERQENGGDEPCKCS